MYDVVFYSDSKGDEPIASFSYTISQRRPKRPRQKSLNRQNGILQTISEGMAYDGYQMEGFSGGLRLDPRRGRHNQP